MATSVRVIPKVVIDSPKNAAGLDLSDHYPIISQINGLKIVSANMQFLPGIIGGAKGKDTAEGRGRSVVDFANYFSSTNADLCCVQELSGLTKNSSRRKDFVVH